MDAYRKSNDYDQCQADSCLYIKRVGAEFMIIALYADDMLLACSRKQLLQNEKEALQKRFCMKDLGEEEEEESDEEEETAEVGPWTSFHKCVTKEETEKWVQLLQDLLTKLSMGSITSGV
eukprot:gene9706-18175_t